MTSYPKIICLMGPTASGKTALAVEWAGRFPVEIINVDSAQFYRGLDIGSGKLDEALLAKAPHRLLGIRDPAESYSAAEFVEDALAEIEDIIRLGRVPLLVGGTMLYFKALQEGLSQLPSADPVIRADIQRLADQDGWPAVHALLAQVDPRSAERLHPNDQQRVQRALEVYRVSGKTMTHYHSEQQKRSLPYPVLNLAITPRDRSVLHRAIESRFNSMLAAGFEQEVRQLFDRGDLHQNLPAIRAVGYRQMWEYLSDDVDYETMIQKALAATRQLAKRQLTWLRGWPELRWLYTDEDNVEIEATHLVNQFLYG